MVRIAYFGTDGCPGHHVIPIRGKFTEEDIKVIESVDCDDFYKVFDVMRFKIAEFKGWTILGIPASLDDHRPGSKTVIFIEGKANEAKYYWALMRPCKNRIYDKSLKGYEGKPLCSECAAIEYSKGGEVVVVPGTWHGKFKKEWPTEEEKKHIGKNGILNM